MLPLPGRRATLLGLLALPAALAQTLREPAADQVLNSFSGSGNIPFDYSPSSDAVSSINIAALLADPNGGNQTFVMANGLLPSSGDEYTAVFAPSGLCGALTLQVFENARGNSTLALERDLTVSCSPIQLALPPPSDKKARSLLKRQTEGGPSGTLTSPSGGASLTSPGGSLDIAYTPVTEGGQTFAIDAVLSSDSANYTVVNGLWKEDAASDITGSFALPSGACGPFSLVVTERQIYQNGAIAFQAAAPTLNITCEDESSGAANATSLAHNATATATAVVNATLPVTANITTAISTATNGSTSATSTTVLLPTANLTLSIPTTITESTVLTSVITTTLSQGSVTAPFTTTATVTVIPSSTSSSASNTTSVAPVPSTSTTASTTRPEETTTTTTPTSTSQQPTRTVTVTASGSDGSQGQGGGVVTSTVQPPSTTSEQSGSSSAVSQQLVTRTSTRVQVVVAVQPGQSTSTRTQQQTVLLISQSAVFVQPNGGAALPTTQPSGAAAPAYSARGFAGLLAAVLSMVTASLAMTLL